MRGEVPFYGDTLEAIRCADDRIMVGIKRVCESLGVNHDSQRAKLNGYGWAVTAMIAATGPDGKTYKQSMIDLDSIPMWLVTIHPSKVAFETRIKLETHQKDAKAALAAWLLGESSARPAWTKSSTG